MCSVLHDKKSRKTSTGDVKDGIVRKGREREEQHEEAEWQRADGDQRRQDLQVYRVQQEVHELRFDLQPLPDLGSLQEEQVSQGLLGSRDVLPEGGSEAVLQVICNFAPLRRGFYTE